MPDPIVEESDMSRLHSRDLAGGLVLVAALATFLNLPAFVSAEDTKRDPLEGELSDKVAFVQTFDYKVSGSVCAIEAKIKFVKGGTYTVAGGYYKGKAFHTGVAGKKFYETKSVKADAGDVITVK